MTRPESDVIVPEIDRDAMMLADWMYMQAEGGPRAKVRAAVFGYLYADANVVQESGMWAFPSPAETAEAYAATLKSEAGA